MNQNLFHILIRHCVLAILVANFFIADNSLADSGSLSVIGNSISKHPKSKDLDWDCECGMAASSKALDYSHILARSLNMHLVVENASYLERPSIVPDAKWSDLNAMIKKANVVVVQLGDNSRVPYDYFYQSYERLLNNVVKNNRLYCISTYWKNDQVDKFIRKACEQKGGVYIFIGDIRVDKANPDIHSIKFNVQAVNDHPKDWSMNKIAQRILSKVNN